MSHNPPLYMPKTQPSDVSAMVAKKALIQRVVNVFETGSPEGDYGAVSIYPDGPGCKRQITYGRSQTTEYGNLPRLLKLYIAMDGKFAHEVADKFSLLTTGHAVEDAAFLQTLRNAGADPVMQKAQDTFFDEAYWLPAITWARANGFTQALSGLVIYDSFIHSGRVPEYLRACFPQRIPADMGNEKEWVEAYVNARHHWLSRHSREILQKTVYRTRCFLREIERDNWSLEQLPINANGVLVS